MKINSVKKNLREGRIQIGTAYQQFRSPDAIRTLAAAGFDWAFLDAEHGGFGTSELQDLCRMALKTTLSPIVRVADLQYALIARALDLSPHTVKRHVANILDKLALGSRGQAAAWYRAAGLI